MTEFSIVVPFYNSSKYIKKCIESVINQSFSNWELLLINDGSTDNSLDICNCYSKDKRIKIINKENEGVSRSRNLGIKKSKGKRIIFLDSDDVLDVTTLESLYEYIKDYDYDIIAWGLMNETGEKYSFCHEIYDARENDYYKLQELKYRAFSGYSFDGVKDNAMHFIVTKAIKRELIIANDLYFNESLKYHEDTLFCINVVNNAKSMLAINKYYYIRTIHNDSVSCSYYDNIIMNNKLFLKELNDFMANNHYNDHNYKVAFFKYQISSFFQCLKIDIFNDKAFYSNDEKKYKLKELLNIEIFCPSLKSVKYKINLKYVILYFILKSKNFFLINFVYNKMKRG